MTPNTPKSVGCFSYLNISSSCASLEREIQDRTACKFKSHIYLFWRRKWQPTPVFLPGESQGQRSLAGCSPWGRTESDMTEQLSNKLLQHSFLCLPILGLYLVALGCWERCGLVEVVVLPPRSPGSVHRFSVVLLSGLGGVFLVPFSCSYSLSFQSCLTLCSPMDCSTPGFPVHH